MGLLSKKSKVKEKLIGYVGVDSGQILITDPSYLNEWVNDELTKEKSNPTFSYSGACSVTLSEEKAGQLKENGIKAVASASGYGDGDYPVYAVYNSKGRVASLRIDFISPVD